MKKTLQYLLVAIGFLQIAGYALQWPALRGLGAMTTASPLPVVFTEVKGVETFASGFKIRWETTTGAKDSAEITPALYSKLSGSYNWRNVYGAAISYGPVLPDSIWHSILAYGLCGDGELARQFGIKEGLRQASVIIETKTAGRNDRWNLDIACDR